MDYIDELNEQEFEDNDQSTNQNNKRKLTFTKELSNMMYGFGDAEQPLAETTAFLEQIVIEFITKLVLKASNIGKIGKITVEDILYLVRKDRQKYYRIKELISMNEELKKARKAFDTEEFL